MSLHIDDRLDRFLEYHLEVLRGDPIRAHELPEIVVRCPHCNTPVRRPVIAKRDDVEAFQQLLEIAEKYLDGQGVREKMFAAIAADIRAGLRANATVREIIKAAKTAGEP